MPYRDPQAAHRALVSTAQLQGGYVTAKQAAEAGFGYSHLTYHVRAGNLERVARGLYRLPEVPVAEHDQLIRLSLMSRGRDDVVRAVVSHATALALHGMSDVLPRQVHLTVPKGWRQTLPTLCVVHSATLEEGDVEHWQGFGVTSPLRTLLDVTEEASFPQEQLELAILDALERGLVSRRRLRLALRRAGEYARERLDAALGAIRR